jgi:hypothetical protein
MLRFPIHSSIPNGQRINRPLPSPETGGGIAAGSAAEKSLYSRSRVCFFADLFHQFFVKMQTGRFFPQKILFARPFPVLAAIYIPSVTPALHAQPVVVPPAFQRVVFTRNAFLVQQYQKFLFCHLSSHPPNPCCSSIRFFHPQ